MQSLPLENSQPIFDKLQTLLTETDGAKIKIVFQTIMTTNNERQIYKLWAYLNEQYRINKNTKSILRELLRKEWWYRTSITGLYSFQVLNKKAFKAVF